MALPVLVLVLSGAAAAGGIGTGAFGGGKLSEAQQILESAEFRHTRNLRQFNEQYKAAVKALDALGQRELRVLRSFRDFSDAINRIQDRPDFAWIEARNVTLPKYDLTELEHASVGANVLLGGLSGAALGTAGAYAASSATSAAVAALGTASTGTSIASLSGAAATNATLAALGGGSLAAGGGGMALGSVVLGSASAGAGILIGGIIFGVVGSKMFDKAMDAWSEMKQAEKEIKKASAYLGYLTKVTNLFTRTFIETGDAYHKHLTQLIRLTEHRHDWSEYTEQERLLVQNTILLVRVLYAMCSVRLVKEQRSRGSEVSMDAVNAAGAKAEAENAERLLATLQAQ